MPNRSKRLRVRTGCLTCRSRRRKCDEGKPSCKNCNDKSLTCRYGVKLHFLESNATVLASDEAKALKRGKAYRKIKFVNGSPAETSTSLPRESSKRPEPPKPSTDEQVLDRIPPQHLQLVETTGERSYPASDAAKVRADPDCFAPDSVIGSGTQTVPALVPVDNNAAAITGDEPTSLLDTPSDQGSNRIFSSHNRPDEAPSRRLSEQPMPDYGNLPEVGLPVPCNPSSLESSVPTVQGDEIELLRFYRYSIAPWLDLGDLDQPFGITIFRTITSCEKSHRAILMLSFRHRDLITRNRRSCGTTETANFLDPSSQTLEAASGPSALASSLMMALVDYISATPERWWSIIARALPIFGDVGLYTYDSDISRAAFWCLLRMDLAAAVIRAQSPLIPLTTLESKLAPRHTLNSLFQQALCLLCSALCVAFQSQLQSCPASNTQDNLPFPSLGDLPPADRWNYVWNETQRWYEQRNQELKPILDVEGAERDKLDPSNESLFPIMLFTTSLALIANVAYHISCLVLLKHKPRLVKPTARPQPLASALWHAQRIAGIADCNRSRDCWDPLFLAGLLLAADRMTHESQHARILQILHRIKRQSPLQAHDEIARLEANWSVLKNR